MLRPANFDSRESALAVRAKFFDERENQSEVKARIVSKYFSHGQTLSSRRRKGAKRKSVTSSTDRLFSNYSFPMNEGAA
jgi:hypothetical protein